LNEFAYWESKDAKFFYEIYGFCATMHTNFQMWVSRKKIDTMFDVGCGAGIYAEIYRDRLYHASDVNEDAMRFLAKTYPDDVFYLGDFMHNQVNRTFDLVFALNVLEHVADPDRFLKKMIKLTEDYIYLAFHTGKHQFKEHHLNIQKEGYFKSKLSFPKIEKILLDNDFKLTINYYSYLGSDSPGLIIKGTKLHHRAKNP